MPAKKQGHTFTVLSSERVELAKISVKEDSGWREVDEERVQELVDSVIKESWCHNK